MQANLGWQHGFNSRERWMRKRIFKRRFRKFRQVLRKVEEKGLPINEIHFKKRD